MVTNSRKRESNGAGKDKGTSAKLENDIDALFRLPLTEFIAGRKTLAAQLKQEGRGKEAERVKSLVKPSVSAWAVNQLYWQHREAFDRLIATGQRFRKAQASGHSGKIAEMRGALDARREALSDLADMTTALLDDAGHHPTSDMIHRITTTLEAMSAYASLPDGLSLGRLTQDVDPPGFDSFASLMPSAGMTGRTEEPTRVTRSQKSGSTVTNNQRRTATADEVGQLEKTRQAKMAAAKVSLQDARRVLIAARARAQSAQAAQKKTDAEVKEAEKQKRAADERLEKAMTAAEDAAKRARTVTAEVEEAVKAVENAERTLEKTSKA